MKTSLRILAFALVLVLMSTSLCGCQALDKLRSNHAVYVDDDTILWNGEEYKRLPYCENFCPETDYLQTVFVTESDVPTLLSPFFGDTTYVCDDGRILQYVRESFDDILQSTAYYGSSAYFCLAEDFDRLNNEIEEANVGTLVYDTYSYSFGEYDETTEWYETRTRILTESEVRTFLTAVGTASAAEGAYDWQMEYIADVCDSTEDMLFFGGDCYSVYRLTVSTVGMVYYVWDAETGEYGAIDTLYTAAFDEMFAPAVEAMEESEWTEDGYELVF